MCSVSRYCLIGLSLSFDEPELDRLVVASVERVDVEPEGLPSVVRTKADKAVKSLRLFIEQSAFPEGDLLADFRRDGEYTMEEIADMSGLPCLENDSHQLPMP